MHIQDIIQKGNPTFSFEFFPPKTSAGFEALYKTIAELSPMGPSFVSITYGAGGSTREMTHDLVVRINETTTIPAIPHLTCVAHSKEEITQTLDRYAEAGIGNILALRGDPPASMPNYKRSDDAFQYAADLVSFIREYNQSGKHPDARGFGIGVAGFPEGHPAMPNRMKEMDYLKAKVDAGADYICTQLFFDNNDFFDFRERCELAGIHVPIIAGIMPIQTIASMKRMAELAEGARFPAKLLKALNRAKDDAAVERVGIQYASQQCAELLDGKVDGIHFYTLNKSHATREIYSSLGL
ncbi:methylenetetrahydrofolate reductase [NAD(P)H] [Persicirhabdus sediminis]|uniref:Methylenetetrahydrofolate reductase n=1 Tax=Persicirhabdus sediminis TaxID=454144 RepID=A0A8J7SMG5_9BACT|nr:methylenetetrahydrofolate reductase [NAD(P)H] [Persicirhabdus sediminis]MBK1791088.1 methylenetetrahydrofolate reductase [NAD(P)H] [Persicirhabdus sediminis]